MADGSIIYEKGKEIGTYNLTKDGKLVITDLPMGVYEIEEIKTLDGLVLDKTKYEITFEQNDLTTKVYDIKLDISNDTILVEFSKTDITGDKELIGATLSVIDENGNVIDKWTSTEDTHKIEGLVIGKEYTLKEEIAPNGYVVATSVKFVIDDTNEIQKVNMIDKVVEISKEDISGEEIEGAKLQVIDADGNVVDEWISGKDAHKVNGLEENKTYTLHEEVSVGNFVKATDIEFKVTTEKETQKVVMIDKLVEVTKTDITNGEELEGAELEVTDEDGNVIDTWISTKEPHQVKGLEEGKTYILKETTAPYGYEITEEIKFVVTTDKETQKVEMKDMPILKNVKVIKVDSETKETIKDKFTFAIYEDPECTKLIKEVKSNKEGGTALFEELRYGTYYIKETKAPNDYELSDRVVKVEINDKGIFVDDTQVEENDNTIEFSFENKKIEVPKTGDESNIKLFIGGIIISLMGIGYIVIKIHKKNK
jgi:LPXTG-motif cell wall-anchored protein